MRPGPGRSRGKSAQTASKFVRNAKKAALSVLRLVLFPPAAIAAASPILIGLLMAWAFAFGGSTSSFAPIAYVLSAVLLLSFCSWLLRAVSSGRIRSAIEKHPSAMRLASDVEFRRRGGLLAGASIDILWAVFNLAFAVSQSSAWLLTLGLYYLTFGTLRLRLYFLMKGGISTEAACRESRRMGATLIVSVLVLSGIVVLAIEHGEAVSYGGIGIYAAATFSFYSLAGSAISFARHRECKSVIVTTICCVNVAISVISMIVLETSMLAAFSSEEGRGSFAPLLAGSGTVAALMLLFLGVFAIINANRKLKALRSDDGGEPGGLCMSSSRQLNGLRLILEPRHRSIRI